MDWTDQCAGSSWGYWTANVTTMPRAFDALPQSDGSYAYVPNVLLAGAPTLVTSPKMVVTYKINPKAVWSDGTPITSADFQYTWDHIAHGKNIYDPTGYNDIASVDDSDPSHGGRDLLHALRGLEGPVRWWLRHPPVAHPARARTRTPS